MKKNFNLFTTIAAIAVCISSCVEDPEKRAGVFPDGIIEVAINSSSKSLSYTDFITLPEHNDFLSPELHLMIAASPRHSQAIRYSSSQQTPSAEMVTLSYEQIPVLMTNNYEFIMYSDGRYKATIVDFIDPETNAIDDLSESSLNRDDIVTKVVIENGISKAYNYVGVLLSELPDETFASPEFQAMMQEYYDAIAAQDSVTTRGADFERNISWLRQKVANLPDAENIKIDEMSNGNIIITQPVNMPTMTSEMAILTRGGGQAVVKKVMSSDLQKTYSQEVRVGEQLISRQLNYYPQEDNISNFEVSVNGSRNVGIQPIVVVSESLTLSDDGTPMISTNKQYFTKNSVVIKTNK